MDKYDLVEILNYIDPAQLEYEEWVSVGMGLKEAGYSDSDWDEWSRQDSHRYHQGECARKWNTFNGGYGSPISGGTIVQIAKRFGWRPERKEPEYELTWDSEIGSKDLVVVDKEWLEGKEVHEPEEWDPVKQLVTYLETLFEASENVGYVTESYEKTEPEKGSRWLPTKGCWDRTAGQLIEKLNKCNGDIGTVIGDYKEAAGAWIRFNPLDGRGCKNENVTDYRYALVESDEMEIDQQHAIIRELDLPVACLVHSGGKSLHALVRVEAINYEEYRQRVNYLYEVCKKNGLIIDGQNKNPSRLSRMPGIIRNGRKQFIVAKNIGKESWNEWKEWIESVNDDLPDPESLTGVWDNLPELSPPLIDGLLRQGHKMLLAGPSKAGKSYSLIELTISIAEGRKWLNWQCAKGRVLYVNLELDRASCLHRFKDVYTALGWNPENLNNIDIWNLRGKSIPMDKLAPKLIRRAAKKNYIAIILDPIYKVITGDENSADQMARFCNQFDLVCHDLGAAVIYCHHHSKGGQGQKRSMDRASGSGVFARDPDALLDLIELDLNESILKQKENEAVCKVCAEVLKMNIYNWQNEVSQDDLCSQSVMQDVCERLLETDQFSALQQEIKQTRKAAQSITGWRIEGTLREFPKFPPVNLWFNYPTHSVDHAEILKDLSTDGNEPAWKGNFSKKKTPADRKKEKDNSLETAYKICSINEKITINDMAEYMGVTEKTVRKRLEEHGGFYVDRGKISKKA